MKNIICLIAPLSISTLSMGAEPVKVSPPQQKTLSSESGQYVFGQISEFRSDQYMLDTKTGRLWQLVTSTVGEGKVNVLQPVPYYGEDGKYFVTPQ